MRKRTDVARCGPLEMQAFYSVAVLARAGNVHRDLLRRLLRANGVRLVRAGRSLFVPLSEIEAKLPRVWDSIKAVEALRIVGA